MEGRGCPCTDGGQSSKLSSRACAVLNTLHYVKRILNEEECRSVGKDGVRWTNELAIVIVSKPPDAVQETLSVLKERKGSYGYTPTAKGIILMSALHQEKLVTEDAMERLKGEGRDLSDSVVLIQCSMPSEVVAKTANVLDRYGHNEEARQLRALNELFTRHLLTAEKCSEMARKGRKRWKNHLTLFLLTKPAEVMQEACQVLEKYGCLVKEELKTLNDLFTRHILTAEECSEVAKRESWEWEDHLTQLLLTKSAAVVQEAVHVLKICGYSVKKELQMLSELYQEKLVIEDEVKRMKGEGGDLSDRLVYVQCTKPPEVVAKSASVLDKNGHNEEARKLRALNELFPRHILSAEECSEVARKKSWNWEYHLTQLLLTKSAVVVQETVHVLKLCGYSVKKELQMLSELYQEELVIEDEVKRMKGKGRGLSDRLVYVQCTKPPEVVAKSANVLDNYGDDKEARKLRALNEFFTKHILTAEECSEVAKKGRCEWEYDLTQLLLTKSVAVVQEAIHVLKIHGCSVKKELQMLSELYQKKLVIEDEVKRLKGEGRVLSDRLDLVQCTKPPEVVARSTNVLNKYGHYKEARKLRVLSELYQKTLVIEDEVERMKGEERGLFDKLVLVQCTKPPEVVARSTNVLDKYGHYEEARKLRVLSELYQEKLVTEDEVERLKGEEGDLIYRLFQYTIHSEEATRAAKVLEKYGYDFEASLLRGEVPIPHGKMPGKNYRDYRYVKYDWRYKYISKAATSTHSTSHLLEGFQKMTVQPHGEEPSLSLTKRSSEEVEEETRHQGSKAFSQSAGEGSGPPREPVKATEFQVSEFLKKHETEFFEVVNPRLSLLRLVRKGVITEDVKSDINTSNTKDAREVLYHHLAHHANVDTLREYCEVAIDAEGYPKMQSLGRKMMEELEKGGEQTH